MALMSGTDVNPGCGQGISTGLQGLQQHGPSALDIMGESLHTGKHLIPC